MNSLSDNAPNTRRTTFWKVAFFIALFAFEVARELFVLESAKEPQLSVTAIVFENNEWVRAQGRWTRIDGGEKMVPVSVLIRCDRDRSECTETTVSVFDMRVGPLETMTFNAQFLTDAVVYRNTFPLCAHYTTRIDLRLKKVFSVREKTADKSELCQMIEPRMEMQLSDGFELWRLPEGHFLPVLWAVKSLVNWGG